MIGMLLMLYEGIVMTENQFIGSEVFEKLSEYIKEPYLQAEHRGLRHNINVVLKQYNRCFATGNQMIPMLGISTSLKHRLKNTSLHALKFNKEHLIICAAEDKNIYEVCSTLAMMEHWDKALGCENSIEGISSLDTLINRMYHAEHIRFKDSHQPVLQQRSEDCLELAKQFGYTQPLEEKENTLPNVGRAYN